MTGITRKDRIAMRGENRDGDAPKPLPQFSLSQILGVWAGVVVARRLVRPRQERRALT